MSNMPLFKIKFFSEKIHSRLSKGNYPSAPLSPFASAYAAHPVKGHFVLHSEDSAPPLTSFHCFGFRYLRRRLRGKFPTSRKHKKGSSENLRTRGRKAFGLFAQGVEVISPVLHHFSTFLKVFATMICSPNFVALHMGQLPFNGINAPTSLCQKT